MKPNFVFLDFRAFVVKYLNIIIDWDCSCEIFMRFLANFFLIFFLRCKDANREKTNSHIFIYFFWGMHDVL